MSAPRNGTKGAIYPRGFSLAQSWPWPLFRSEDIVQLNYGKALRDPDRHPGGIPVYGTNGQCGWHNKALATGPGVILGRKGQGPLGVEWSESDFWVIDTAYFVTPKTDQLDLRYFYYLVKYIGLNHLKDGTSNPSLSRVTFADLLLPMPPLEIQRAISRHLYALDCKIEVNRRLNDTLEAIARTLFKSRFLDVGLYPISNVGTEFDLIMGQSPPSSSYNEIGKGLPFFQGRTDFGARYPEPRFYCTKPTRIAEKGDTLVSVRAPVGEINMAKERCCIGRGVAAIRHKSRSSSYTYYCLRSLKAQLETFEAGGTVFGSIARDEFGLLKVPRVPDQAVRKFEDQVHAIDESIEKNYNESLTLASLRDLLLPRLISGKLPLSIRVGPTEREKA